MLAVSIPLNTLVFSGDSLDTLIPNVLLFTSYREGNLLMIYMCSFHVLHHFLLIYICKLHWNMILLFLTYSLLFTFYREEARAWWAKTVVIDKAVRREPQVLTGSKFTQEVSQLNQDFHPRFNSRSNFTLEVSQLNQDFHPSTLRSSRRRTTRLRVSESPQRIGGTLL